MPGNRFIPLEVVGVENSSPAFTDVIVALYSQELVHAVEETEDLELISFGSLRSTSEEVFALGSSIGLSNSGEVVKILEQTHSDVSEIFEECTEPLKQEVARAKKSSVSVSARFFLDLLFDPIADGEPVESDLAHQILSISFEYGCILSINQRPAAIVVRNAFNRELERSEKEDKESSFKRKPLGDLGDELFSAYKLDFGWPD